MLIPSDRHREADLELWREMEEVDLIHWNQLQKSGKIERSIAAIQKFVSAGPCYAGWSGGKDSTVLAHLIKTGSVCGIPFVYIKAHPVFNPETAIVQDALLAIVPLIFHEVEITYRKIYTGGYSNPEGDKLFFNAFRTLGTRYLSGIRADESGVRKIRMRRWGLTTANTCAPLGWWTCADVFAYLAHHRLPVHPAYAMLGGGRWNRSRLRVDELAGFGGNGGGRNEWEREYYGDVLRCIENGKSR